MTQAETFVDILVAALERAGGYNRLTEEPPVTILWPDRERAWASLVPRLRTRLPLLTLGPYEPEQASGPVAWLRCMVARTLPGCPPPEVVPLLYLPGAGSQDLRNSGKRIADLAALVDLIYRSALWCDPDGRDWSMKKALALASAARSKSWKSRKATCLPASTAAAMARLVRSGYAPAMPRSRRRPVEHVLLS